MPSASAVRAFLARLAASLETSRVRLTWKADDEMVALGWSVEEVLAQLAALEPRDLLRTEPARSPEYELIWVFCPLVWELDQYLWIRLAEDAEGNIVISFHLAERDPWT